jgi:hypothetical protein
MVRRLYRLPEGAPVLIRPALTLADQALRAEAMTALHPDDPRRLFVYFQDKLGGEIGLSKTAASPEISFDITVIELQTADTHGSYRQAVTALTSALDLHGKNFPQMLAENPEWAGRNIEGPNISNVFKRTRRHLCPLMGAPLASPIRTTGSV